MRRLILITVLGLFALSAVATQDNDSTDFKPTPKSQKIPEYQDYRLVWNDEFNVDGVPSKEWSFERGFVRNEELQWYQPQNATVRDGCLVIEGRHEQVTNTHYDAASNDWRFNRRQAEFTSSSITTRHSFHFKYGRMEVRAKIPTASGSWPAIWVLGNKYRWPMNGEIDLMEYYIKRGAPSILANACWGDSIRWKAVWDEGVTPFTHFTQRDVHWAENFHVWRMDWDKHFIRIFLDGELMNEIDLSKTINRAFEGANFNPFSNDDPDFGVYILLNLALGGNGGTPDLSAFPLHYLVDYVRVYQR